MLAKRMSLAEIAEQLNAENVATITGRTDGRPHPYEKRSSPARARSSRRSSESLGELRVLGAQPLDLRAIDGDNHAGRHRAHARLT